MIFFNKLKIKKMAQEEKKMRCPICRKDVIVEEIIIVASVPVGRIVFGSDFQNKNKSRVKIANQCSKCGVYFGDIPK